MFNTHTISISHHNFRRTILKAFDQVANLKTEHVCKLSQYFECSEYIRDSDFTQFIHLWSFGCFRSSKGFSCHVFRSFDAHFNTEQLNRSHDCFTFLFSSSRILWNKKLWSTLHFIFRITFHHKIPNFNLCNVLWNITLLLFLATRTRVKHTSHVLRLYRRDGKQASNWRNQAWESSDERSNTQNIKFQL